MACDAFERSRPLRVVTHAHADHVIGLKQSLSFCQSVIMTKATKDMVEILRGVRFHEGERVKTLNYGESLEYNGECITLMPADHILGAAQVLVEMEDGNRMAYTGDFRIEGTPVIEVDILVIEATYGSPSYRRPFNNSVKQLLTSMVEDAIKHKPVYIFGYYGKLQEVMHILRSAGVKVPFIMPKRIFHLSKVYEKYGVRLGELICLESDEAWEMLAHGGSCVIFRHVSSRNSIRKGLRIYISGWEFNKPCKKLSDEEYLIALSDHSDFDGLLEYVKLSRPKFVIVDNYRVGCAETFAEEIRKRLGIQAEALPKSV